MYLSGDILNKNNPKKLTKVFTEKEYAYRSFFENSPNGNLIFDHQGNLLYSNKAAINMLSPKDKDLLNKNFNLFENLAISPKLSELIEDKGEYQTEINVDEEFIKSYFPYSPISFKEKYLEVRITQQRSSGSPDDFFFVQLRDITEEKQKLDNLKENEILFRSIVENSHEGIFMVDDQYKFVYANDQLSEILNTPKEEIIGEDFRKFVDEDYVEDVAEKYKKRQRGEKVPPRYFIEVKKRGGERRRVELSSTATTKLKGGVKTIAQILDVTDKTEIQRKLNESIEIFNKISDQTFMTILILQDNEIKYSNRNFGSGIGYSKEEIKNWTFRNFIEIIHPKDRDFVLEQARKKQKGLDGTVNHYSFRVIKKDGSIAWQEIYSKSITYDQNPADLIMMIDITEKKESENQLIESEKKFRRIFEAIPDLFFLISEDLTVLDYQGKEEQLYISPEEFLGKKLTNFFSGELNKKVKNAVATTLKTKKARIVEYGLNFDGEMRFFEARLLYYDKNQVAIFIREITHRKRAVNMIKEEYEKLKELDQIRKDLISRVSHELKTPIMSISGALEMLLNLHKDNFQKDQIELLHIIIKNNERLESLIRNLLDVIRIENQRISIAKKNHNINTLIKEVSEEMKIFLKQRRINLSFDLEKDLILPLDKIRIEQVFINLLSNAIKNTPPNGRVIIKTQTKENRCVIVFQDTGIGLTEKEKDKIFTKFGKIERHGEGLEYLDIRGSGLGLYISKQIILLHNGEIEVDSKGRHKGTKFIIKLPLEKSN